MVDYRDLVMEEGKTECAMLFARTLECELNVFRSAPKHPQKRQ